MARRSLPYIRVQCTCGQFAPLLHCACNNEWLTTRSHSCEWCQWWDIHEPHDQLPSTTNPTTVVEFFYRHNENTLTHPDHCDCEPCATQKMNRTNS